MTCSIVSSLAHIEEHIALVIQNCQSILEGDVLHSNILSGSNDLAGNLNGVSVGLAPCVETTLQSEHLGHVIAQSRQNVGGSLCIALTGVANQNDVLVQTSQSGLHGGNAGIEIAFLSGIHVVAQSAGDVAGIVVSQLADIEEHIALVVQDRKGILNGDVLHSNIFSGSGDLSRDLDLIGIGLTPGSKAALQGEHLGHVITQGRQNVGGGLSIALTGVADQNDLLVQILNSRLHGSNTGVEIAFLGSIHVVAQSAGDVAGLVIGGLTDVEEHIAIVLQNCQSVSRGDVLHSDILAGSGDGGLNNLASIVALASNNGHGHHESQQQCKNSLHDVSPCVKV